MGNGKWKKHLLRTSLPLELRVAELLGDLGFWLGGEFHYTRVNEQGWDTEFSVDVRAAYELKNADNEWWGQWAVLAECKYASPGVQWVFSPYPQAAHVIIGTVSVNEDLATRRITDKNPVLSIDYNLDYCMKGAVLHDSGSDVNSIKKGLYQLRYGMPHLVTQGLLWQLNARHDEDLHIVFSTPILVTTAQLYVLRHEAELNDFHRAKDLEVVAKPVDALITYETTSPHLRQYAEHVFSRFISDTELKKRIDEISPIMKAREYESYLIPATWHVRTSPATASERVLVINLDALPNVLGSLIETFKNLEGSIDHFAELRYDSENDERTILQRTPSSNEK